MQAKPGAGVVQKRNWPPPPGPGLRPSPGGKLRRRRHPCQPPEYRIGAAVTLGHRLAALWVLLDRPAPSAAQRLAPDSPNTGRALVA